MPNLPSPLIEPTLRDDLPRYPPLIQLIRVTAATVPGPAGVAQTAGSSVLGPMLYVAFTQQLRTDSLIPRDREPCLVDLVGNVGGGVLSPGFYTGRLSGSFNDLPVYEVTDGGGLTGMRKQYRYCCSGGNLVEVSVDIIIKDGKIITWPEFGSCP